MVKSSQGNEFRTGDLQRRNSELKQSTESSCKKGKQEKARGIFRNTGLKSILWYVLLNKEKSMWNASYKSEKLTDEKNFNFQRKSWNK